MSLSFKDDATSNSGSATWQIDGQSVSFQNADIRAENAAKICDCMIDNTIKYVTSTGDGASLGFFAFIWNALYFSVADTLAERELEREVLKHFLAGALKIFNTVDNREDAAKFLLAVHEIVLEDLSKAKISTDNKDGILRAHQMALILANDAKLYDGSVIPNPSQDNAFLLAATSVKRNVASILSPPSPPPAPVPRPQAAPPRQLPAAVQPKDKKPKAFIWFCIIIAFFVIVVAAITGAEDEKGTSEPQLTPRLRPQSGEVLYGSASGDSEITVTAARTEDCVVSLKTASGTTKLAFYVRAGDTVTVSVPAGKFYAYFASGDTWYGYREGLMFGKNTSYSKDDDLLDFSLYTWEYTLYPVTNGNFSETPIDEDEFFD